MRDASGGMSGPTTQAMAATREAATAEGPKAGLWSGVLDMAMSLNGKTATQPTPDDPTKNARRRVRLFTRRQGWAAARRRGALWHVWGRRLASRCSVGARATSFNLSAPGDRSPNGCHPDVRRGMMHVEREPLTTVAEARYRNHLRQVVTSGSSARSRRFARGTGTGCKLLCLTIGQRQSGCTARPGRLRIPNQSRHGDGARLRPLFSANVNLHGLRCQTPDPAARRPRW